ncbi:cellulose synthase [Nocardioides litoris]|uniref:cellulose synthase n=1 Tax=Nocardioides litoris TaxID=1926648 RepID=UPI001120348B|nr:cellulose synthase [Nocardioides litoris]
MDDASYGVLAIALTILAGIGTWVAYQRRGLGAGLKGAGITLLPIAAWLTETLRMLARVGDAVGDWATRLVLSPAVWAGIVVAGVAVVLYGAGRVVSARGGDTPPERRARRPRRGREELPAATSPGPQPPAGRGTPAVADDDLADIEAILRKRGIS